MDDAFAARADELHHLLSINETDMFWSSWNAVVENTFLQFCKIENKEKKWYIGRGKPNFRKRDVKGVSYH